MRLEGKVAVVTGAQQGIGNAIARRFAAEGAAVVINYLDDQNSAEATMEHIRGNGGLAKAIQGDITDPEDINDLMAAADDLGGISILVNNAGIQAAARQMIAAGRGGAIINLTSASAYRGPPLGVHYAASKGGIISMTRATAMALAGHAIRVNAIAPGLTDTAQPRGGNSESEIAEMAAKIPLGGIVQPEDIADAAVFLASEESRQMTGQVMHVNGGDLLR